MDLPRTECPAAAEGSAFPPEHGPAHLQILRGAPGAQPVPGTVQRATQDDSLVKGAGEGFDPPLAFAFSPPQGVILRTPSR